MDGINYFSDQIIKKEVDRFVEELDPWLDKVFAHQQSKSTKDAEHFIKELSKRVTEELDLIHWDRKLASFKKE